MFQKILVANRGEIAVRIIRACHHLGIAAVAVYSDADREALHVRLADEAYCIGPAPASQSYLSIPAILSVATVSGADAIHPGYGFLSENPDFREICDSCRIAFIGPSAEAMAQMGEKAAARRAAEAAGVPIVKGTGIIEEISEAKKAAAHIGYPVLIKAAAGGGGKGMRVVEGEEAFENTFRLAQQEAKSAFGNGALYLEKYLRHPRHVEIQVFGDHYGHVVALGERDCSLQRHHQKVIEESPSTAVDEALRKQMSEAACCVARAVQYEGAGTVEFLLDETGHFYFIEMNTRIQVEHGVTEMVGGFDLVTEQIRVAAGAPLSLPESFTRPNGAAIECRVTAEDPQRNFAPSAGKVERLYLPGGPGVRIDTALYAGCSVVPFYDPMIAKVICWGRDRAEALGRMVQALSEFEITGIQTTLPFLQELIETSAFESGRVHTQFLEEYLERRPPVTDLSEQKAV